MRQPRIDGASNDLVCIFSERIIGEMAVRVDHQRYGNRKSRALLRCASPIADGTRIRLVPYVTARRTAVRARNAGDEYLHGVLFTPGALELKWFSHGYDMKSQSRCRKERVKLLLFLLA